MRFVILYKENEAKQHIALILDQLNLKLETSKNRILISFQKLKTMMHT